MGSFGSQESNVHFQPKISTKKKKKNHICYIQGRTWMPVGNINDL